MVGSFVRFFFTRCAESLNSLVRCAHSFVRASRNSWRKIVRTHQPWSNLYVFLYFNLHLTGSSQNFDSHKIYASLYRACSYFSCMFWETARYGQPFITSFWNGGLTGSITAPVSIVSKETSHHQKGKENGKLIQRNLITSSYTVLVSRENKWFFQFKPPLLQFPAEVLLSRVIKNTRALLLIHFTCLFKGGET